MPKTKQKNRAKSPAAKQKIRFTTPPVGGEIAKVSDGQGGQNTLEVQNAAWENTAAAKAGWLAFYSENLISISGCCKIMRVGRSAFYEWLANDPDFKAKVREAEEMQNDMVEDQHYHLVKQLEPSQVRFHLERRTEKWKAKQVLEHHVGNITLEDLIDKEHAQDAIGVNRGVTENPQQAKGDSSVQAERGPNVLLEASDSSQPATQGPTERTN